MERAMPRATRRRFLGRMGASAGLLSLAGCAGHIAGTRMAFPLGVASGYPGPEGIVLWTRLAPEPLAPDGTGGMPDRAVSVVWEVAEDPRFERVARRGDALAEARWAHSLHVEVVGLRPGRDYWYRFLFEGQSSAVGHARTAPAPDTAPERLRFAHASCQHYEQGWFTAHRHMAAEDLDLVAFLGDYIYESSWGRVHVRRHGARAPETLAEYRVRHALYRADPDLQACHAAHAWIVTWDDHEVQNDYAADRSERLWSRARFLALRAAAYRAFYEHMPLPEAMQPRGPNMAIHARLDWGTLARFHILDDRQYRSYQVCPKPARGGSNLVGSYCGERFDPELTMLGAAQEAWLDAGFASSRARWNVLAQQTLFAPLAQPGMRGQTQHWTDGWDGYPAARQRLVDAMVTRRLSNPLIVGGDVHACYAADILAEPAEGRGAVVASEICGTSITSQGPGELAVQSQLRLNPHLRYANGEDRGYVTTTLSAREARAELRAVESVKWQDAPIATRARFAIEAGRPGVQVVQA